MIKLTKNPTNFSGGSINLNKNYIIKNNINIIRKKIKQMHEDNKLFLNKRGFSTGFTWVFAIVSLFGLGILYIVFEQVFSAHLVPVITGMTDSSTLIDNATKTLIQDNIAKYMIFFRALPLIIFLIVIIYMFVASIRKERESEFF